MKKEVILKEVNYDKKLKYKILKHNISADDLKILKKRGWITYLEPLKKEDEYYKQEWGLYWEGNPIIHEFGNYFLSEKGAQMLRMFGYNVKIHTIEEQNNKRKLEEEKRKRSLQRKKIIHRMFGRILYHGKEPERNGIEIKGEIIEVVKKDALGMFHKYFVIDKDGRKIWALEYDSGRHTGNVVHNNVILKGRYVEYSEEIEKIIRLAEVPDNELTEEMLNIELPEIA